MKKYIGWQKNGRKFTREEFKNTFLAESGVSYKNYSTVYEEQYGTKPKPKRKALARGWTIGGSFF